MTDRPPLRCAIVGTGAIAHAHARAIAANARDLRLVAAVDIDLARAEAFAVQYDDVAVFTDIHDLLDSGVDLVHICTPPQTHAHLAAIAMQAGAIPLIEKPTALSLAEMDELARVSAETGVTALTLLQHRYGPAAVRLRRLVAEGQLGRPLVATCDTLWYRDDDYFAVPWRGRWELEGGGPTMGHGIHQFDLMLSILGPWAEVTAFAARQSRPTDTEDVSVAAVRFADGALGSIVNSVVSPRESSRLRFDFEYATVEVEHLYGYRTHDWRFTPAPGHEDLAGLWDDIPDTGEASSHVDQLAAIAAALRAGVEPGVGLASARHTLELAAAIYASAFRRRPVAAGELRGDDAFVRSMSGDGAPWPRVSGDAE
jgi:predicted dehydrogenase